MGSRGRGGREPALTILCSCARPHTPAVADGVGAAGDSPTPAVARLAACRPLVVGGNHRRGGGIRRRGHLRQVAAYSRRSLVQFSRKDICRWHAVRASSLGTPCLSPSILRPAWRQVVLPVPARNARCAGTGISVPSALADRASDGCARMWLA